MLSDITKLTRKERSVMKQAKAVLKLIDGYKKMGLIDKKKADEYKAMIDKDIKVCEDAKRKDN